MSKQGRLESDTDFDTVTIIRKHAPPVKTLKSSAEINAAQRRGIEIETNKKYGAAGNKQHKTDKNTARLDDETEELHHERVAPCLRKAIMDARRVKELTQIDLAKRISEKVEVVKEYESGNAVTNQTILVKMERVLGVKLRGKDIGKPLAPASKAKK